MTVSEVLLHTLNLAIFELILIGVEHKLDRLKRVQQLVQVHYGIFDPLHVLTVRDQIACC
jgi:hypothetical protein